MRLDLDLALAALASAGVVLPLLAFGSVATLEVLGRTPSDRRLAQIAKLTFSLTTVAGLAAGLLFLARDRAPLHFVVGHWFAVGSTGEAHYGFDVGLLVDEISLTYLVLTAMLAGTVGAFSLRYLEGERGAGRFFQLLMLFAASLSLLTIAESLDLLFVGWEIVGITSALLIAFYRERGAPIRHALVAFAIYRVCDVGLLSATVLLHHFAGTASLPEAMAASLGTTAATVLGFLLLFASLGKSAQWPFSGWLPRAMEGPTPSSAIFYGALSVHAGAYLLLRTAPLWDDALVVRIAVVAIGVASALTGSMAGRAQVDAKSSLAYASVTQVGIVFVWIGLGWYRLALLHVVGHAFLRTLELLRAPSLIADFRRLEAELGASVPATGAHYETLIPSALRSRLYGLALGRGALDAMASRLVAVARASVTRLDHWDRRLLVILDGSRTAEPETLPELALEREAEAAETRADAMEALR
ncbi:MAG: proton-conducting membrane transporter [Myxococcales bacterium]|nr:proton-conducting membrane transporter [Myxococcales bacterium]